MRGNLQGLLAQAQKMQKNVERIQAELGNLEVVGESGAGLVKITMTCKHEARKVEIGPSQLTGEPDDKELRTRSMIRPRPRCARRRPACRCPRE